MAFGPVEWSEQGSGPDEAAHGWISAARTPPLSQFGILPFIYFPLVNPNLTQLPLTPGPQTPNTRLRKFPTYGQSCDYRNPLVVEQSNGPRSEETGIFRSFGKLTFESAQDHTPAGRTLRALRSVEWLDQIAGAPAQGTTRPCRSFRRKRSLRQISMGLDAYRWLRES